MVEGLWQQLNQDSNLNHLTRLSTDSASALNTYPYKLNVDKRSTIINLNPELETAIYSQIMYKNVGIDSRAWRFFVSTFDTLTSSST